MLTELLPSNVEIPSSYEVIGHIAHLNLLPGSFSSFSSLFCLFSLSLLLFFSFSFMLSFSSGSFPLSTPKKIFYWSLIPLLSFPFFPPLFFFLFRTTRIQTYNCRGDSNKRTSNQNGCEQGFFGGHSLFLLPSFFFPFLLFFPPFYHQH